jgi:hypothetical protein
MEYIPLNFRLMGNPANWAIITLMVMIAGIGVGLVYHPNNEASK